MITIGQSVIRKKGKLTKKSHYSKLLDFECMLKDYYKGVSLKKVCLNYLKENNIDYNIDFKQRLLSKKYYYFSVNVAEKDFNGLYQHMYNFIYEMQYISAFNDNSRLYIQNNTFGKYSKRIQVIKFIFVYDIIFKENKNTYVYSKPDVYYNYTSRYNSNIKLKRNELEQLFKVKSVLIYYNPITETYMKETEFLKWYYERNPIVEVYEEDGTFMLGNKRYHDLTEIELERFKKYNPEEYEELSKIKW